MDQNYSGRVADDARAIAMALHFVPARTEIGADGLIHRPAPSFVLAERRRARQHNEPARRSSDMLGGSHVVAVVTNYRKQKCGASLIRDS